VRRDSKRSVSTSIYLYPSLFTSIHLYPPLYTSILLYSPLSTFIYLYPSLSTSFHLYSTLFTSIHLYIPLSTSIHLYPPLFTSIHLYSPLFTSIHLYSPLYTSIHLYPPVFTFRSMPHLPFFGSSSPPSHLLKACVTMSRTKRVYSFFDTDHSQKGAQNFTRRMPKTKRGAREPAGVPTAGRRTASQQGTRSQEYRVGPGRNNAGAGQKSQI